MLVSADGLAVKTSQVQEPPMGNGTGEPVADRDAEDSPAPGGVNPARSIVYYMCVQFPVREDS